VSEEPGGGAGVCACARKIPSYEAYLATLERSRGPFLLLPHAHAGGGPGRFDLPRRPAYQTNVEVVSVHGVFEAFFQQWLAHGARSPG
jgi:hypothetical protein